jgi:hypothetical protein
LSGIITPPLDFFFSGYYVVQRKEILMKKSLFVILSFVFFAACSGHKPKIATLNNLHPGITRAELSDTLGVEAPVSTDFVNGYYLLKYEFSRPEHYHLGEAFPYYFVFDKQGKLVGWEEVKGQEKIIVNGVSIMIPFPSRG